jgi:hypothetical protein
MTDAFIADARRVKESIARWIDLARGRPPLVEPSVAEARRRAGELLCLVRQRGISLRTVRLTEDLKSVLYALVGIVAAPASRGEAAASSNRDAQVVYDLISGIHWPDDDFGEKQELLKDCIEAGALPPKHGPFGIDPHGGDERLPMSDSARVEELSAEQVRVTFDGSLAMIHEVLLADGFSGLEAAELEQELFAWFARFCRRTSSAPTNLRAILLAACAQFSSAYRRFRDGLDESTEGELGKLLRWMRRGRGADRDEE